MQKVYVRTGRPVVYRSLAKTSDKWLTVNDGVCKDNTSKDPFSQCENLQGIRVQVKN